MRGTILFDTRAASVALRIRVRHADRAAQVPRALVTGYLGGSGIRSATTSWCVNRSSCVGEVCWKAAAGRVSIRPRWSRPSGCGRGVFNLLPDALGTASGCCAAQPGHTSAAALGRRHNAWWSDHVVKFDYSAQLDLLGRFGIRYPDARYLGGPSCSRCSVARDHRLAHRPQRTPRRRPTRWRARTPACATTRAHRSAARPPPGPVELREP